MPRNGNSVGRRRRSNKNAAPMPVISLTPAQAFERQVVRNGNDSTCLYGKFSVVFASTATPFNALQLSPFSFGARCAALAGVFSRYRFKYVRFKFTSTNGAYSSIGVLDDASGEGNPPADFSDCLELRASASFLPGTTVPSEFEWKPADPKLWYYTAGGSTGSEQRLVTSGILYGASSTGGSSYIEVDYCIVFKGAIDIGTV